MAISAPPPRAALGLPEPGLVLASLVPHWKLTAPVFEVWLRALRDWPDAVLWLVDGATAAKQALRTAAATHGIAPERLVFQRRLPMDEFLGALGAADLFLDTFPYGGHSTTSAALYAGLPIVALIGQSFASRVAGSVLHAAGQDDLVAHDLTQYEQLIRSLGDDRAALAARRAALAPRASPLFDLDRFVRALERGYATAWERWCAGDAPQDITVADD
jgi:predicted O-linked N-acetylglucosamine transferase (SPINDLY family)